MHHCDGFDLHVLWLVFILYFALFELYFALFELYFGLLGIIS